MSVIEQSREMTPQEKIDWDYSYTQGGGLGKVISNSLDYMAKKCCDDCDYFQQFDEGYADGFCMKNISNELGGEFIIDSGTFYCSYHKLRINNE